MRFFLRRPLPEKNSAGQNWTYGFFIDFQVGNKKQNNKVIKLTDYFKKKNYYYKILGAYKNITQMSSEEILML